VGSDGVSKISRNLKEDILSCRGWEGLVPKAALMEEKLQEASTCRRSECGKNLLKKKKDYIWGAILPKRPGGGSRQKRN